MWHRPSITIDSGGNNVESKILEVIKNNEKVSIQQIADSAAIPKRSVERIIKNLKEKGTRSEVDCIVTRNTHDYANSPVSVFTPEEFIAKINSENELNYYGIADMKNNIESLNGWLYRRIRMCIWKQWKLPRTRKRKLIGLGLPEWVACEGAYSRKAYWRMAGSGVVQRALTKERLINWGFYDLATSYQSLHVNY